MRSTTFRSALISDCGRTTDSSDRLPPTKSGSMYEWSSCGARRRAERVHLLLLHEPQRHVVHHLHLRERRRLSVGR